MGRSSIAPRVACGHSSAASPCCCSAPLALVCSARQGEDAAVRQQERVPGHRRHAGRHDARGDRARAAALAAEVVREADAVTNVQSYAGTASPYNFNGLVRHYFLRRGPNVADIQVNLVAEGRAQRPEPRDRQARPDAAAADRGRASARASRSPKCRPGPPVLQTLVAEVYGPDAAAAARRSRGGARDLRADPGVVDVDWYVEDAQAERQLDVDEEKAALHGISQADVARWCAWPARGATAGLLHDERAREDVPIVLRLPRASASDPRRAPRPCDRAAAPVALGELTRSTLGRRGEEHLPQEPDAGDLRHRRRGRRDREPGLRHPEDESRA